MLSRLSERTEFWIVVTIAYSASIVGWTYRWSRNGIDARFNFTDQILIGTVAFEFVVGLMVILFLRARAYTITEMRPRVSGAGTAAGVGLWLVLMIVWGITHAIAASMPAADRLTATSLSSSASIPVALLCSIVNPIFEEGINLGYVQQKLRGHGVAFSIGVALLFRLFTHIYQGPIAVVSILPLGLILGLYYWRSQNLWPVIVAHGIADMVGLTAQQSG